MHHSHLKYAYFILMFVIRRPTLCFFQQILLMSDSKKFLQIFCWKLCIQYFKHLKFYILKTKFIF